jgi:hypothetical protein
MYDPRLLARETARRECVIAEDEIERYYNIERAACLPFEHVMMLRDQHNFELRASRPTSQPPGFALLASHLGVPHIPDYLLALHSSAAHHNPSKWEVVHRLLYEIMSKYSDRFIIASRRTGLPMATPIHLRVIPYSPNYVLDWPDELTQFWHITRLEIEFILECISRLHHGKSHQVVYESNFKIRERFVDAHKLLITAFSIPMTPKPLIYHADIDLESPNWHPFIRPFERAFLLQALPYFDGLPGPGRKLEPLLHSLLRMRFAYQAEASHAFVMGKLTYAPGGRNSI